jgi:hypothetical protein
MSPPDPEEGFKVRDRRRQIDTDDRSQAATEPPPVVPPPPGPSARTAPSPPQGKGARASAERSLAGLVMMLASSAVIAMGDAPDPASGQRHRDLAQAAEVIDLLLLLREKTEGNRTPEETQMFEDLLYDLQLRYVNATKRPG